MKPFNLELAKSGVPIITRDGRPVQFIAHVPDVSPSTRVVVAVDNGPDCPKTLGTYFESGRFIDNENNNLDLFHPSVKKSGWINIYKAASVKPSCVTNGIIYNTKEVAEKEAVADCSYVATIEIHWEE